MNGDFLERAQQLMLNSEFNEKLDSLINSQGKNGGKNISESRGGSPIAPKGGSGIKAGSAYQNMSKMINETPSLLYSPALDSEFKQSSIINENLNTNNNGIDYSLIKTIVNESIRENLKEIRKGILAEGTTLKGIKIAKGNKIQLVDSKGNLYEGVLKLKASNN